MKTLIPLLLLVLTFSCINSPKKPEFINLSGPVFGTGYTIKYQGVANYQKEIDSIFVALNESLSTYIPYSSISKINRNETDKVDQHLSRVLEASKTIYRYTEGSFDPTIGNVVNAWNFGSEDNKFLTDSTTIDSLMNYVGLNRLGIRNGKLVKSTKSYLEFNAIAKGYAVDVVGEYLEQRGVANYLVEIGGEIRVRGQHPEKQSDWRVGIQRPRFDGDSNANDYVHALPLKNEAMATSGTYRKFKTDENGNRYAHIINTKTGYPTKTNILSVSVIAKDCMIADAYATAFQAMGIDKVKTFLNQHPELKVFLIFENKNKVLETLNLNGFPE